MNTQLLGLLAETSIHPGAEKSSGIVDLPVAREAATDYPVIPGSSLKGALLGLAREKTADGKDRMTEADRKRVFGTAEVEDNIGGAGALLVSDARLLLLPVRSLQSAYKWVTCPHLLERFARDRQRAGLDGNNFLPVSGQPPKEKYLGADGGTLFLEVRQFERAADLPEQLVNFLGQLVAHEKTRQRLGSQLVVLNDDDFSWFARYGLAVQARNVLKPDTKTSDNLWYEENIPADALFYALLAERDPGAIEPVKQLFIGSNGRPYLQVGGNETVGMGWFAVTFPDGKGGAE